VSVERARDELFAAHLLASTGFAVPTIALALRAALAAAEGALLELDRVPPPEPAAVVAAFVRHVVGERGLDPAAGRALRSLLGRAELTATAAPVPPVEGPAAIADATAVVDAVDAWLTHSDFVSIARSVGVPTRPRPQRRRR
jgi:hypothetical protein